VQQQSLNSSVYYTLNMATKKEQILKALKQYKRLATARIMGITGLNLVYTKKYLQELEEERKIVREEETNATYWKII